MDQVEDNFCKSGGGRPGKTSEETIKKDLSCKQFYWKFNLSFW